MTFFNTRQLAGQAPSTSAHYDHRWLLFIIPICLLFVGLIFAIWFILRRRKKQKQRRSVLRNRVLVVADQEKQREREERRLSRGNSFTSRISRMASMKSNGTRTYTTRSIGVTEAVSQSTDIDGHLKEKEELLEDETHEGELPQNEVMIEKSEADIEHMAESKTTLPVVAACPESNSKVRIVDQAKPFRIKRKEVANMAEVSSPDTASASLSSDSGWTVCRQDSQRSVGGVTSSQSHATQSTGSNPFSSPSTSSAGHDLLSPTIPELSSIEGGGLARKLSGLARLRQPSPAASSQRSESRASRKSSTRSSRRGDTQLPSSSASAASLAAANWTYTPQASKWKSSSTDVSVPGGSTTHDTINASQDVVVVSPQIGQQRPSTGVTASSSLSPTDGQLVRKPSTGVAGSKFVESFDD